MSGVMQLTRNAIRGAIIAPPGRKLVIADLANIEGRVGAWVAGEEWKLDAFRAYDAGTGPDLYKLAYARAFGIKPEDVDKFMRQIGKVLELFMQYEGGVGAFITGAATYRIELDELALASWERIPDDVMKETVSFLGWCDKNDMPIPRGISMEARIVCDALKRMWRAAHPAIASIWKDIKTMMVCAIENPGTTFDCRKLKMRRDGSWLRVGLPSGRALCYPQPEIRKDAITFMGMDPYTKRWSRQSTYGGKVFENVCQGLAGDFLKANMPTMEARGYEIVLTVHDEAVTETPNLERYNAADLASIMATIPAWAAGIPLAAAGFECYRYRKE